MSVSASSYRDPSLEGSRPVAQVVASVLIGASSATAGFAALVSSLGVLLFGLWPRESYWSALLLWPLWVTAFSAVLWIPLATISAATAKAMSIGLSGWRLSFRSGVVSGLVFGVVVLIIAGEEFREWDIAGQLAAIAAAWFGMFGAATAWVAERLYKRKPIR